MLKPTDNLQNKLTQTWSAGVPWKNFTQSKGVRASWAQKSPPLESNPWPFCHRAGNTNGVDHSTTMLQPSLLKPVVQKDACGAHDFMICELSTHNLLGLHDLSNCLHANSLTHWITSWFILRIMHLCTTQIQHTLSLLCSAKWWGHVAYCAACVMCKKRYWRKKFCKKPKSGRE